MIHGTAYVDWIQIEFPKIADEFKEQDQPDCGLIKSEANNDNKGTEIESIWENIDDITNAICTQDSSILDIIRRCQKIETIYSEEKLQELILNIETKYDNKLNVFMNTINHEINVKIERINNTILQSTQSTMADFKIEVQNQINTYTQARNDFEKHVSTKINNLVSEIEKIDFTLLE